ncbi:D-amino acid dehydrogenase [Fulvimarina endophytica]|uniref:D-amino acid dehydrogenase n=1 Tax=Fulvimarina endophytica TaxID=2293836 RepID=A0A371WYP7_9HYPH|nr:D-amino acid dehydrogenase [Fulvimarina endophytica]RFC62092.1 D-amino acid dehydrogenase [Fulvimarina endophytica]
MRSVAILGAGITGITTAYKLLERGFDVTVFERHDGAALDTSFANAGQLSASNAEVWNRPGTFLKGLKWMFTRDAPLLVHPAPTPHKLSWMLQFVLAARSYEENTIRTTEMAIAARRHLLEMADKEGIEFDIEKRGILHIFEDEKELAHAREVNALLDRGGLSRRYVTPQEIAVIEPAVTGKFVGGYFTESDFTGDIHTFTRGLAEACARRGAKLFFGTEVVGTRADDERADVTVREAGGERRTRTESFDAVVVCAGVSSRAIARGLGDRINIYPVKGYSITVPLKDEPSRTAAPHVSILDDEAKIVGTRLGQRLRVAGTAEFAGENRTVRQERIEPLLAWCRTRFPGVSLADYESWAGLRPMMPDMMPKVGRGRARTVFYNTGHGHLGWTLGAITAETVAAEVAEAFAAGRNAPKAA